MLAEFAVVSIVLFLVFAAVVTYGLIVFQANLAQQTADVGARELSRLPIKHDATLWLSVYAPSNQSDERPDLSSIYDPNLLVVYIPITDDLLAYFDSINAPTLNRMLALAMVPDPLLKNPNPDGLQGGFRFPGTVVIKDGVPTVLIPLANPTGQFEWVLPVEEVLRIDETSGDRLSRFPSASEGIAAIRVNIPVQSSIMSAHRLQVTPLDKNLGEPIYANDDDVVIPPLPDGYSFMFETNESSETGVAHSGRYGLGTQFAYANLVRPYRKVVTAKASYRREALLDLP